MLHASVSAEHANTFFLFFFSRCVVFNNRGVSGEVLLVRMISLPSCVFRRCVCQTGFCALRVCVPHVFHSPRGAGTENTPEMLSHSRA